jgi:antitoxin VapB
MPREWATKTFKSGNSVALRIPKSAGIAPGEELRFVEHADGTFSFWREADADKVLDSLYGSMSPGFMKHGRGDIEQSDREWDRAPVKSAA